LESHLRVHVLDALAFALAQVRDPTEIRNACDEFWHSLNRKQEVYNEEVYGLIADTLKTVEAHRPRERIARTRPALP
jgi:hypothetical protein